MKSMKNDPGMSGQIGSVKTGIVLFFIQTDLFQVNSGRETARVLIWIRRKHGFCAGGCKFFAIGSQR